MDTYNHIAVYCISITIYNDISGLSQSYSCMSHVYISSNLDHVLQQPAMTTTAVGSEGLNGWLAPEN